MCKGSNTSTTTSSADPAAMTAYYSLLNRAQGVANTPFQDYGGEFTAPVNAQQQLGIANINAAQPVFGQALTMAQNAAQPLTQAQIQQYQSPYTQDVVNATQNQFNNQNAQQQSALTGNATAQNALGGNRVGVAQSNLANQQQLAQAPVIAGLYNQSYNSGVNTALTQQQAMAQGAYGVANTGQAMLGAAGAQIGAGTLQQQTQQQQDAALYNQFLMRQAYPFQTTQWLAGIDTGVGSQLGGTSSTTGPAPNQASQYLGAGLTAASLFLKRGGGVSGYAAGGGIAEPNTMPESPDTLEAQQDQLEAGDRPAQMFPNGSPELDLPEGMERAETPNGVFHYDPDQVSHEGVQGLSGQGRENELLNLGPFSKQDIMQRLKLGEQPVAIVERAADGTEVRSAMGTTTTAPIQIQAMEQTKSPGSRIVVEDPRDIIAGRAQANGIAPGRAPGGGVAGSPYADVSGYVPTMGISAGRGAPSPPGSPKQDGGGDNKMLNKGFSDFGGGLKGLYNNWADSPEQLGGTADSPLPGLDASDYGAFDFNGQFARGGVVGLANGGVPDDGSYDEFGPTDPYYTEPTPKPAPPPPPEPQGVVPSAADIFAQPSGAAKPLEKPPVGPPDVDADTQKAWADPNYTPPSQNMPSSVAATPVSYTTEGDQVWGATKAGGVAPRGIRNNNPGNIEDSAFARSQPGYTGSDGRFATYATPEAGQNAASNLLVSYSNRGINTVNGIINRWAPKSDGNDTASYAATVARSIGVDPNEPLNLNDPNVRSKVAQAMFKVENGTGGLSGGQPGARPGVGPSGVAPAAQEKVEAPGILGLLPEGTVPDSLSRALNKPKLQAALMSAGLGMLASRSPFFGNAVGEGGLAGLQTYQNQVQQERQAGMTQQRINLEAQKLMQSADFAQKRLGFEQQKATLPYTQLTLADQLREQREQQKFAIEAGKPVQVGVDPIRGPIWAQRDPKGQGYRLIDPETGRLGPLMGGLNPNGTVAPTQPQGSQGFNAPQVQGAAQVTPAVATIDPNKFAPASNIKTSFGEEDAAQPLRSVFSGDNKTMEGLHPEVLDNDPQMAKNPGLRSQIMAVAQGKAKLPSAMSRIPKAQYIRDKAFEVNPDLDENTFTRRQRVENYFAVGTNGGGGQNIVAMNRFLAHAGSLLAIAEKLDMGRFPTLNAFQNWLTKNGFGKDETRDLLGQWEVNATGVGGEAAKVFAGSHPALADRTEWNHILTPDTPLSTIKAKLKQAVEMGNQALAANVHQYNEGMRTNHRPAEFLTPRTREIMETIENGGSLSALEKTGTSHVDPRDSAALRANKDNPAARAAIDKKYGAGTADKLLGGK